jgi:hypothetical protein
MKNYTNEERFDALNRHRETLSISKETGFTVLTQHINYKNIEDFCDTILHYENFNKTYGEVKSCFDRNTELYKKRKEIFFNENRELTVEETEFCVKKDNEYQIFLKKCHDEAQL